MRRMMTAIGLGLSAVLLTSGCQLVGGGNNAKSKPAQTTKSTGGQQAQAAPSPQSSPGTPAVTKSVTYQTPSKQGASFTIGFAGLKANGQLATLTLVWTPHGVGGDTTSIFDMTGHADDVSMIDTVNLKRYVLVSDSEDNALGPNTIDEVANDRPMTAQYTFAAPPPNASLDIYQGDHKAFESVRVTQ